MVVLAVLGYILHQHQVAGAQEERICKMLRVGEVDPIAAELCSM